MTDAPLPFLSVTGESPLGEARNGALARAGNRRILGLWRYGPLLCLVGLLALYIAALVAMGQYDAPGWMIIPLGVLFFLMLAGLIVVLQRVTTRIVVKSWTARGLPAVNTLTYAIDDEALSITGATSTTRLRWAYVSELAPAGKLFWVLPAAGLFYYLPRRFFASPAEEAAFLDAMLRRMPPAARARSAEARKLTAFE